LKETSSQTNAGFDRAKAVEATAQDYTRVSKDQDEQIYREQGTTASATENKSLSEVFRETSKLIEQGKLQQAGVYLEKFKDNVAFTAEERGHIARVLGMINEATTRSGQQIEKVEKEQEKSGNGKESRVPAENSVGSDNRSDEKVKEIAELYYSTMAFYRTGQLLRAREGFVNILESGLIPESVARTIRSYISDIDNSLARNEKSKDPKQ